MIPNHVAIILDGNRRYAQKHKKNTFFGHRAGIKKVEDFIQWCQDFKVKETTLYCFSAENFQRAEREVNYLMNLFRQYLKRLKKDKNLIKNDIKVRFVGDLTLFPKDIQQLMKEIMKKTEKHGTFTVNLALGYGSRQELIQGIKRIITKIKNKTLKVNEINEKTISEHLYVADDVDLFIRPGGERRLSNYLLWQSSYAELYFSNKLWPEFTKQDFKVALDDYRKRERRFGK